MNIQTRKPAKTAWLLALLLAGAAPLRAQPYYLNNLWANPGSGKWEVASNWSAGTPPGTNDDDQIYIGTTVTIDATTSGSFPNTMTVSYVAVAAPSVTLDLNDAGTNVPLHILLDLDVTNDARLVITNSALQVDGAMTAGNSPGVGGSFELDSGWAKIGSIILGNSGFGDAYLTGGMMTVLGNMTMGASPGSSGSLQMNGGTLKLLGNMTVGASP